METIFTNTIVLYFFISIFIVLAFISVVSLILLKVYPEFDFSEIRLRIRSWWILVSIFAAIFVLQTTALLLFFILLSYLGLKAYLTRIPTRRADRRVLFWAYVSIPFQYLWIAMDRYEMFTLFIPVLLFFLLPLRMVIIGETKQFLRSLATLQWGLMTTVFSISHIAYLMSLPIEINPLTGGAGLVLYLVLLTLLNDGLQYFFGKRLGRHALIPNVSTYKSWEGLLGGVTITTTTAMVLSLWLTPLYFWQAFISGLLIGLGGFVGDVTIAAVKSDIGVTENSNFSSGHDSVLDRLASLTYTAPLFFHFVYYFHYY